jgi:hypothetical protein
MCATVCLRFVPVQNKKKEIIVIQVQTGVKTNYVSLSEEKIFSAV